MLKLTRYTPALALALAIIGFAGAPKASAEVKKTGVLSRADFVNPTGYYYEIHKIKMKFGTTYKIDLTSNEFDTFLIVENESGKSLAENDDGGVGLNSRLLFRPPYEGFYTYRVRVTSYAPRRGGAFTLHITP